MSKAVSLKITDLHSNEARRTSVDATGTFDDLRAAVFRLFPSRTAAVLKYADPSDGELVTLCTTDDFHEAVRSASTCATADPILRIMICDSLSDSSASLPKTPPRTPPSERVSECLAQHAKAEEPEKAEKTKEFEMTTEAWRKIVSVVPHDIIEPIRSHTSDAVVAALMSDAVRPHVVALARALAAQLTDSANKQPPSYVDAVVSPLPPPPPVVVAATAAAPAHAPATPAKVIDQPMVPVVSKWRGEFVGDVTLPSNGCVTVPMKRRIKIWRLRNCGSEDWPRGCRVVPLDGCQFLLPPPPATVVGSAQRPTLCVPEARVGADADVALEIVSPGQLGMYRTHWGLVCPEGLPMLSSPLVLELNVVDPSSSLVTSSMMASSLLSTAMLSSAKPPVPYPVAVPVPTSIPGPVPAPAVAPVPAPAPLPQLAPVVQVPSHDPAPAVVRSPVNKKWKIQLQILSEMGFDDEELNVALLEKYKTIEALVESGVLR